MTKCICSVVIEESRKIKIPVTENPGKAKSFNIRKRRAIFYEDGFGKYKIPENAEKLSFPEYEEHKYNIFYGDPFFT